ncbi:phenoloxidase-activating factor 2 [Lepeophtheirus salmonis]|uniref:phenoloxidase-activating factor 2 n=1 Tax=Lepeophtheirus salmonis TaxID=72036 RepID=UPI001AE6E470|nr:phenoloxidase-activating factor 2-like [Lepeophtheirus salmonis]
MRLITLLLIIFVKYLSTCESENKFGLLYSNIARDREDNYSCCCSSDTKCLISPSKSKTCSNPYHSFCCYESYERYMCDKTESTDFYQPCPSHTPLAKNQCGTRDYQVIRSFDNGQSHPEEFPWVCIILTKNNEYVGTCVIIPEKFDNEIFHNTHKVLTVAHKLSKVNSYRQLKIRVLEYNIDGFRTPERHQHKEYEVAEMIIHDKFNRRRLKYDIAILRTNKPIDLHDVGVNAACLPSCDNMFAHTFPNGSGVRCWIAGWGKNELDKSFNIIQRKVNLPLISDEQCEHQVKSALKNFSLKVSMKFKLHKTEICAGGEGKTYCQGDGGAPLVCQSKEGYWHVVGLAAWGIGCARNNVPGVYTKVSQFKKWIERH